MINYSDRILITGATGFIGPKVVKTLLNIGFTNLICFVRPSSNLSALRSIINLNKNATVDIYTGDLLSQEDCDKATEGVQVIFHLAAVMRDTSFESSYLNNVVTTRYLLDGAVKNKTLQRFVNVSSLRVYSNFKLKHDDLLDETCNIESELVSRGDAYCNSKVLQEKLIKEYNRNYDFHYVILRPGIVFGPGNIEIHRMIGRKIRIGKFEIFLHLGGHNTLPLTYLDNCADAIVFSGIKSEINGEIFNVVDDDLPTSSEFLKLYKQNIKQFKSIYIPYRIFYFISYIYEKYLILKKNQLPPALNRKKCSASWKGNIYSNKKIKDLVGWMPRVKMDEALKRYFEYGKNI